MYLSLCLFLDWLFENRPIQRFWFLETVARLPYSSYISCISLYESLGWWRAAADLRKVHFAEELNETIHCQARRAACLLARCAPPAAAPAPALSPSPGRTLAASTPPCGFRLQS